MPNETLNRLQAGLGYRLSKIASDYWRRRFENASPADYLYEPCNVELPQVHLFSFCGKRQFHELLLCVLSFLKFVGKPAKWTVVSDGTLDPQDYERLGRALPGVRIEGAPWTAFVNEDNRPCVDLYSRFHPLGKKLALISSLPHSPSSLYLDSDILFFEQAFGLRQVLQDSSCNRYVTDTKQGLVLPMLNEAEAAKIPVNSGFIIFAADINWRPALQRLHAYLSQVPDIAALPQLHHLEQTAFHLAVHQSPNEPLETEACVAKLDDAYSWRDRHVTKNTILRHYIGHSKLRMWREARRYLR